MLLWHSPGRHRRASRGGGGKCQDRHPDSIPEELTPGTWRVLLRLPDAGARTPSRADVAVQMANENTWDAALGGNVLGAFVVVR
ncbi:hypothetical protein [Pendulispora albinea]|uniref:DUF4832 domain-containing protein n=1 Tax=Pendulispora albinea TaxID=2741071 RepID=A0ABZ2MBZ3_9BACT